MAYSQSSTGGSASIRGYLVQTLVALLDIAQADPPFLQITLEPDHANDQFDYVWSNENGDHAVQVKSTINEFKKSAVEQWASKLKSARSNEDCLLILVGNYETKLEGIRQMEVICTMPMAATSADVIWSSWQKPMPRNKPAMRFGSWIPMCSGWRTASRPLRK